MILSYVAVWNFRIPPTPPKWLTVKEGMTRKEIFDTLGWVQTDVVRKIETDHWGYSPFMYRNDRVIEIEFAPNNLQSPGNDISNKIIIKVENNLEDWWWRLRWRIGLIAQ